MGGSILAVVMSLVIRESAVAWSRSVTGAVTMMTPHSIASRSYILGDLRNSHRRSWRSRVPFVVRKSAAASSLCDDILWQ